MNGERGAKTRAREERRVEAWNAAHHVGAAVRIWPGLREGEGILTRTTCAAGMMGDTAVVGTKANGCVALTHVEAVPDDEVERLVDVYGKVDIWDNENEDGPEKRFQLTVDGQVGMGPSLAAAIAHVSALLIARESDGEAKCARRRRKLQGEVP